MADAVVCTLDLPTPYQKLLGDLRPPRAARDGQYSPSAVVWHVGIRGVPQYSVEHHNIHFGEDWSSAFEALHEGRLMPEPSRLVTVPHSTTRQWHRLAALPSMFWNPCLTFMARSTVNRNQGSARAHA